MSSSDLPESAYERLGLTSDKVKVLTKPMSPTAEVASPNVMQAEPLPAADLPPDASSTILYAEVLLNIRTVTLFASLRTASTHDTKAHLSTDGSSITVSHEGESASIRLPIKAKGGGDAALNLPSNPSSKELSLRLQIEEQEGSDLFTGVHAEARKANIVSWDGASLNAMKGANIFCKNCQKNLVLGGEVKEWRDLPSENWAEMMDFWHCHKPDEHHLHDHTHNDAVSKKGYAAGTRLKAARGVGFVDLASLLLKEQDCYGVQLSPTSTDSLICRHCQIPLGTIDHPADGWRIWKWSIAVSPASSHTSPPVSYSTQKWISARLLYLIENTGVRKFHVHPDTPRTTRDPVSSLLLWVFTPDLLFSSSIPQQGRQDPTRAMKVFYKRREWRELKPGEREEVGVEDVVFPAGLYRELERGLEEGKNVLPVNARVFQGWHVGLLERFDVDEGGDRDGVNKEEGDDKM